MPLTGCRVLIAEDTVVIAMLIEDDLRNAGATILGTATTVAEAMAFIERERPDMAVLDVRLGGEATTPIAHALAARCVPFVTTTDDVLDGLEPSFAAMPQLLKPYDPHQLIARLEGLWELSSGARQTDGTRVHDEGSGGWRVGRWRS